MIGGLHRSFSISQSKSLIQISGDISRFHDIADGRTTRISKLDSKGCYKRAGSSGERVDQVVDGHPQKRKMMRRDLLRLACLGNKLKNAKR